ncbi:hypothetical protein [Alicycliphilus denitrificans]|uniref:carboxylate--amine ligase n=1 Tax=Alicycliphilus denitrificans TaxID=179636 RepID=UPI00384DE4D4
MAELNAIILGGGLNALGVVRALAAHGVRCAVVSHEGHGPALHSRHALQTLKSGGLPEPSHLVSKLGVRNGQCALFLTEENDVSAITVQADRWNTCFRTYLFRPDLAHRLLSKTECDQLATKHGAPAPKTITVTADTDHERLNTLRLPCVLKPALRNDAYSLRFSKAYRIDSHSELRKLLEQMREIPVPMIIQEWIEGEDSDIYFNLLYIGRSGKLLRSFVGRKTLCWPPAVGGTAACIAAPEHHAELTLISQRFLGSMDFRGLIGIEYKRDARDGAFYLIEPTVYRTDYQHEIAALNGSDWLYAAYLDMMQYDVPSEKPYSRSRSWIDYPAARYSRQMAPPNIDHTRNCIPTDAYFRISDPLPGLMHYGRLLWTRISAHP